MGTCCFTPRKTHFLWWYWLLLASVVGIPMFLAAWHVARHPAETEEDKKKVSKEASNIFWGSAAVGILAGIFLGSAIISKYDSLEYYLHGSFGYSFTLATLLIDFFAYFLAASYADRYCRKAQNPFNRILAIFGVLIVITSISVVSTGFCLVVFSDFIQFPFVGLLLFLICMLPAHYWRDFQDNPTRKTSWRALGAILIAVPLFYGAARYGIIGHYCAYEIFHGRTPNVEKAAAYVTSRPIFLPPPKPPEIIWEDRK